MMLGAVRETGTKARSLPRRVTAARHLHLWRSVFFLVLCDAVSRAFVSWSILSSPSLKCNQRTCARRFGEELRPRASRRQSSKGSGSSQSSPGSPKHFLCPSLLCSLFIRLFAQVRAPPLGSSGRCAEARSRLMQKRRRCSNWEAPQARAGRARRRALRRACCLCLASGSAQHGKHRQHWGSAEAPLHLAEPCLKTCVLAAAQAWGYWPARRQATTQISQGERCTRDTASRHRPAPASTRADSLSISGSSLSGPCLQLRPKVLSALAGPAVWAHSPARKPRSKAPKALLPACLLRPAALLGMMLKLEDCSGLRLHCRNAL